MFGSLGEFEIWPNDRPSSVREIRVIVKLTIQLWLGTLHRLGQEGFHVIALDLPGYGFSEGVQLDIRESAPFMKDFIELFKLTGIILVAPSTSIKVS